MSTKRRKLEVLEQSSQSRDLIIIQNQWVDLKKALFLLWPKNRLDVICKEERAKIRELKDF